MTEYENYRTQDHYEMSLTQKIFALNFITNYLPIFLVAFIYVPFGPIIIPQLQVLLHRNFDMPKTSKLHFESDPNKLRNEVIALTVTGQISSALGELLVPYIKSRLKEWWRKRQQFKRTQSFRLTHDEPEEEYFLGRARKQAMLPSYNVHEDISEMVIQFGYLALFSPVWPLIPIGFLINNWFELRSDFLKICIEHQRPAPVRSDGLGPWVGSLEALTWLGSISTAAIVHLFGTHNHALGFIQNSMGKWYSLPITVFISEHLFMALRAGVRFALHKIGSKQMRKERTEQYAERKKHLDELENSVAKSGHLNVKERERRKSIRMTSEDVFWTRQVEEDASVEIGVGLIRALKDDCYAKIE
jgi:anoctamin-10